MSRLTITIFFTTKTIILFAIDPLLVLIEFVPFGYLLGFLRKSRGLNDKYFNDPDVKPQTSLTAEQLMRFAWQVADGMCYLSSKKVGLKHNKLRKILLNSSLTSVRVFGLDSVWIYINANCTVPVK